MNISSSAIKKDLKEADSKLNSTLAAKVNVTLVEVSN